MSYFGKSTIITIPLIFMLSGNAVAECQDLKTTEAIVEYVCNYELVSSTQCRVWREDVRQMTNNTEIIVDSFISWNMQSQKNAGFISEN